MFVPRSPITTVNGFTIKPGYFGAFETLTDEGHLQALREEWAARITKADPGTEVCGRCNGRGYTRKDGRIGCVECHGIGRVAV